MLTERYNCGVKFKKRKLSLFIAVAWINFSVQGQYPITGGYKFENRLHYTSAKLHIQNSSVASLVGEKGRYICWTRAIRHPPTAISDVLANVSILWWNFSTFHFSRKLFLRFFLTFSPVWEVVDCISRVFDTDILSTISLNSVTAPFHSFPRSHVLFTLLEGVRNCLYLFYKHLSVCGHLWRSIFFSFTRIWYQMTADNTVLTNGLKWELILVDSQEYRQPPVSPATASHSLSVSFINAFQITSLVYLITLMIQRQFPLGGMRVTWRAKRSFNPSKSHLGSANTCKLNKTYFCIIRRKCWETLVEGGLLYDC